MTLDDIIPGCDYNENYIHSTETLNTSNAKPFGFDSSNCKSTNYLNPTYNSKINLCINDDYISIVDNVSDLTHKRESKLFDENMNLATPLINAHEPKISRKIHNNSLTGNKQMNEKIEKKSTKPDVHCIRLYFELCFFSHTPSLMLL